MFDYKDKVICASFEVWLQASHFLKIFSFQHLQLFCVSMLVYIFIVMYISFSLYYVLQWNYTVYLIYSFTWAELSLYS